MSVFSCELWGLGFGILNQDPREVRASMVYMLPDHTTSGPSISF